MNKFVFITKGKQILCVCTTRFKSKPASALSKGDIFAPLVHVNQPIAS